MMEWRRVLSLLAGPHSVVPNWPTGLEGIVEVAAGRELASAQTGRPPNPADPSSRPWTISTEFIVEAEPGESTRRGGA